LLIQSREEFSQAITTLLKADVIAVDTETNWTDNWDERELMGVSTYCKLAGTDFEIAFYFPFRHRHDATLFPNHNENLPYSWLRELAIPLERSEIIVAGHGFKFDLKVFAKDGISINGQIHDTLLFSWMDDENKYSHELEDLAKLVGDKKLRSELKQIGKDLGGWEKIPPEVMEIYACGDARITYFLREYFLPSLEEQELLPLYPREEKFLRVLNKIETRGVQIDKEVATKLSKEALASMQETLAQFGYDPAKPAQLAHRLFSEPPDGLGLKPIGGYSKRPSKEFSPHGIPIMDAPVLSRLNHPECEKILDFRSWQKANSTWYEGWFEKTTADGRIHPEFKQHGTKTTRLSCNKPNMQQIPRDIEKTPVKKMLRAKEGYELWEFDYSQVEFRLGSLYAECGPILAAYKEGADVHQLTSDRIGIQQLSNLDYAAARYAAKQTNFLTIYGGGAEVLVKQLWRDARIAISIELAEEILAEFHKTYPEFRRINNKCEQAARSKGYVKMWNGRRRHFDVPWKYKDAYNSIIQGGCAQIMEESLIELDEQGYELVCQVHDAAWIEIPKDSLEQDKRNIRKIMEWPSDHFDIPFPVDEKKLAA
jgi:DNA polymerase-1